MTRKEQDKLWNDLSEEKKKEYRKEFQQESESYHQNIKHCDRENELEYHTGYSEGFVNALEELFGEHNLKPSLTYEDIIREIDKNSYISPINGEIYSSKEQVKKENTIHKLLNVAKFLNKNEDGSDWVPDFKNKDENNNKIWSLGIDKDDKIRVYWDFYDTRSEFVHFRTQEIAQQTVQILGEDVVRTALGNY